MSVATVLTNIAWRASISAIAGVLVSAFAVVVLTLGTDSAAELAAGLTSIGSMSPIFSAIVGAGFFASLVVFACLAGYEGLRSAGPWLVANRRLLLAPLRAVAWSAARGGLAIIAALRLVARSTVVEEAIWLARVTGKVLIWVFAFCVAVGGSALTYLAVIGLGVAGISLSTRIVVAMLDDPPRPLTFALFTCTAVVCMYIGVAAFTLCGWFTYRMTRAGLRRAGAFRLGASASTR